MGMGRNCRYLLADHCALGLAQLPGPQDGLGIAWREGDGQGAILALQAGVAGGEWAGPGSFPCTSSLLRCPLTLTRRPGCSAAPLRVARLRRSPTSVPSCRREKPRVLPNKASLDAAASDTVGPGPFFLPGGLRPGARASLEPTLPFTVRLLILTSLSGLDSRQAPAGRGGRGGHGQGCGTRIRNGTCCPVLTQ